MMMCRWSSGRNKFMSRRSLGASIRHGKQECQQSRSEPEPEHEMSLLTLGPDSRLMTFFHHGKWEAGHPAKSFRQSHLNFAHNKIMKRIQSLKNTHIHKNTVHLRYVSILFSNSSAKTNSNIIRLTRTNITPSNWMSSLLDIMYYYAIFNYVDSFNNTTTVPSEDDKKERISEEDAKLIPEITYCDSETSSTTRDRLSLPPLVSPPAKGLAATTIQQSRLAAQSNNKASCAICILDYKAGDTLKILPDCNHIFHKDCIVPWITERSGHCPLCRMTVRVISTKEEDGKRRQSRSSGRCADVPCSIQWRIHIYEVTYISFLYHLRIIGWKYIHCGS